MAQRACDPDDPPTDSRGCTRPLLYTTHRFWPGVRLFSVFAGRDAIIDGVDDLKRADHGDASATLRPDQAH